MSKGYITRWKLREKPEDEQGKVDYWFDSHAENAASWDTKEEAELVDDFIAQFIQHK
jgi:hypothetical protein